MQIRFPTKQDRDAIVSSIVLHQEWLLHKDYVLLNVCQCHNVICSVQFPRLKVTSMLVSCKV